MFNVENDPTHTYVFFIGNERFYYSTTNALKRCFIVLFRISSNKGSNTQNFTNNFHRRNMGN
jgi:hypothetical protein